jgi:murein DD-endopeptidase MepM/ murein hydrolase activator NlpD
MRTYRYAQKLRFFAIILLISLFFSNLLPGGVTIVHAQSPETATPDALTAVTATSVAPPPESPTPADSATPTGSAVQETATASQTPPAADSPTGTPTAAADTQTPPPATPSAPPPEAATPTPPAPPAQGQALSDLPPADFNLLSDGQFVYGPNVGDFTIAGFAAQSAPQLSPYAEALYGRAEFNSINPRLYLALMEMATRLVSDQSAGPQQAENPFGLAEPGFTAQLDALSKAMFNAYYLHLYNYSALPVDQRSLPALTLADGSTFDVPGTINAGSYAVLAGLAAFKDAAGMAQALDGADPASFTQTYQRLFPQDDPLSQANRVGIPGGVTAQAAPAGLLQFPYPRGEAWTFGGVHSNDGSSGDMSSIDFSKNWPQWGADTSTIWVAAAAGGVPSKISSCNFHIDHGGGWMTAYYHLDNIQSYSGSIQQNDQIGRASCRERV